MTNQDMTNWIVEHKHSPIIRGPKQFSKLTGISFNTIRKRVRDGKVAIMEDSKSSGMEFSPVMVLANYTYHWTLRFHGKREVEDVNIEDELGSADYHFESYLKTNTVLRIQDMTHRWGGENSEGASATMSVYESDFDISFCESATLILPVSRLLKNMAYTLYRLRDK